MMSDILAASMAILSCGHEGPSGCRQTYFGEEVTVQTKRPEEVLAASSGQVRD